MQSPKKDKTELSVEYLPLIPNEIIHYQILSRLPIKSLLRFRSVCKLWRCWISDPQFKTFTQRRRILIFDRYARTDLLHSAMSCIHEEDGSLHSTPEPWNDQPSPHLLGSCNGFVLIGLDTSIFLWNPSTRACNKVLQHKYLFHCYRKRRNVMTGLCYDSRTNDYKVIVRLIHLEGRPFEFSSLQRECWKRLDNFPSNFFVIHGQSWGAVVNGNQHWLVKKKSNDPSNRNKYVRSVIYFDGEQENFNEIGIPIPVDGGGYTYGLRQLDGSLAFGRQRNDGGSTIEIWIMKKYNVVEPSWSLCFRCPVYVRWKYNIQFAFQLLCFTKKGDEVTLVKDGNEIFPNLLENESPQSTGRYNFRKSFGVAQYVESLASLSIVTTHGPI